MQPTDLSALTDRQLDALAAEVVTGWIVHPEQSVQWGQSPDDPRWHTRIPTYSASLDAARLLEDEIERRGLICEYTSIHLYGMLCDGTGRNYWRFRRATARQCTIAAILAVRGAK